MTASEPIFIVIRPYVDIALLPSILTYSDTLRESIMVTLLLISLGISPVNIS